MAGTIKHRHQTAVAPTGADVDRDEWNDSLVVAEGTDGQYMQRDSAQTDGWKWATLPSFDWTVIFKTATEQRSLTTITVDDASLVIPVLANKSYIIRMRVFFTSGTTPDFKFELVGPASPTRISIFAQSLPPNSTTLSTSMTEAYAGATANIACTTGHDGWIAYEIGLDNGANAGNVSFQWAQNTSDATPAVVYAGSFAEYRQLN